MVDGIMWSVIMCDGDSNDGDCLLYVCVVCVMWTVIDVCVGLIV